MSKTKDRIRESELRYRHSLGQNFIYDDQLLRELAELSGVTRDEDVLEIGPGAGSLTKHLCDLAGHVLAVELDERLIPLLTAFMAEKNNFTLVQGDIMTLDLADAAKDLRKPFAVVANIPYYITTPLIQRLLTCGLPISRMALMVQKEVAEKIMSSPGDEGWGPLALRCGYLYEARVAREVPARCFTPVPKVDSAFVVMNAREAPSVRVRSEEDYFRIVSAAFAMRRKTMLNNLCAVFRISRETGAAWLSRAGADDRIRGERMTPEQLAAVADRLTEFREGKA